jgi:hypothetical protein
MFRPKSAAAWRESSVAALILSVFLFVLKTTIADPDLWGHLRFGRDLFSAGHIIRSDPYSYLSAGRPWIDHEWLSEAVFWRVFSAAGAAGLGILKMALDLGMIVLCYRHLLRRGFSAMRAGILLLVGFLPFIHFFLVLRPQVFTHVFFLLFLLAIEAAEHGDRRWLPWLAPLTVLWVNLHGGVLAGLAILAVWCALRRESSGVLAVCALCTLVNPYGIKLPELLLRTATTARPDISEWKPLALQGFSGATYLLTLGISVAGFAFSGKKRSSTTLVLFACTAVLPLMAIRHGFLYVFGMFVFAGEHVGDAWNRHFPENVRHTWALACINAVAALGFMIMAFLGFRGVYVPADEGMPAGAIRVLKDSGVAGNLAVHFDWGEYALWHLGPEMKVSVDGRRETLYSRPVYEENLRFIMGLGRWDDLLEDGRPQAALVSRDFPVFALMRLKPGWSLAYEDSISGLFVRNGSPLAGALEHAARAPSTPTEAFP